MLVDWRFRIVNRVVSPGNFAFIENQAPFKEATSNANQNLRYLKATFTLPGSPKDSPVLKKTCGCKEMFGHLENCCLEYCKNVETKRVPLLLDHHFGPRLPSDKFLVEPLKIAIHLFQPKKNYSTPRKMNACRP